MRDELLKNSPQGKIRKIHGSAREGFDAVPLQRPATSTESTTEAATAATDGSISTPMVVMFGRIRFNQLEVTPRPQPMSIANDGLGGTSGSISSLSVSKYPGICASHGFTAGICTRPIADSRTDRRPAGR